MRRRLWVSYDLGLNGDYPGLYRFLDNHKAQEIGNSAATFVFECDVENDDEFISVLKGSIAESLNDTKNVRIYVIRAQREDGNTISKVTGSFLLGRRKSNPWEGYGDNDNQEPDSE